MNLLGQRVTDSVTGLSGTVIAQAQFLHESERALFAYGANFENQWLPITRLQPTVGGQADAPAKAPAKSPPKTTPDAAPGTLGAGIAEDAPPATPAVTPAKAAQPNGAAHATNGAAPATNGAATPAAVATETYAKVAAAFIVLGKAGQGATIQKILATHGATHAKQVADNAFALADVLAQAQAAIAALPGAAT